MLHPNVYLSLVGNILFVFVFVFVTGGHVTGGQVQEDR